MDEEHAPRPPRPLTSAEQEHFAVLLRRDRADALRHSGLLRQTIADVRAARSDGTADDEHDPEGPTLSQEWAQLTGLSASAAAELNAIDRALERISEGVFGSCSRCGLPIGRERLDARPTAELCIDCARLAG